MSRWGLSYKGVELVTPEEWNALIDALEELDKRTPDNIAAGKATFTGDGTTKSFQIEHGLGDTPTVAFVGKASPSLPDIDYWEADSTYITVHFKSAPVDGITIMLWWLAIKL